MAQRVVEETLVPRRIESIADGVDITRGIMAVTQPANTRSDEALQPIRGIEITAVLQPITVDHCP